MVKADLIILKPNLFLTSLFQLRVCCLPFIKLWLVDFFLALPNTDESPIDFSVKIFSHIPFRLTEMTVI